MPRIDLTVPFAEKDETKRLGARWDAERKRWYVPDGVDAGAFGRWLPSEPDIGVRSSSYFIAQTSKPCWKCNEHQVRSASSCLPGTKRWNPTKRMTSGMRGIGMTGLPVLEKVQAMKPAKETEQHKAAPPPKNYGADISTLIRMIEAGEL